MKVPPFSLSKQLSEIGPQLDEAILRVLHSGQYIGGAEVSTFEKSFAQIVEVPFSVGCNSGTDALTIALNALGVGKGDEVITCSFSFFATAEAICSVGAKPVFVDVTPDNYLIDIEAIEKAITSATKVILPVHLFGCPVDMNRLMTLARSKGLKVVEDCAQACGAKWNGKHVGSFGDVGCFSFFPTKNLGAAGDGGAITTSDENLANKMRELSIHGMPHRYLHTNIGYNSRLDALQAAILNIKLQYLPNWIERRRLIAKNYMRLLNDIPGIKLPDLFSDFNLNHAWNQFVIRVSGIHLDEKHSGNLTDFSSMLSNNDLPNSSSRDWLQQKLKEQGINTIIYYPIPIHLQPAFNSNEYSSVRLPVTETLCSQVLSLPIFPEITLKEQEYVAKEIKLLINSQVK